MPKEISIRIAKPGDVLAKEVFSTNGGILLSKGVKLTPAYIDKLKKLRVITIVIEE